ncbi:MAG TPA: hypothetical protein V6D22_18085 [Candidatus Obscuribacterales bacterium]
MYITRPQWPHTVDDIVKSLDGIWGVVGATDTQGNVIRLERSMSEPTTYVLTQYKGQDESDIIDKKSYTAEQKSDAVRLFASKLGFST